MRLESVLNHESSVRLPSLIGGTAWFRVIDEQHRPTSIERVAATRHHALPRPVPIDADATRWDAFVANLGRRAAAGEVPTAQFHAFMGLLPRMAHLRRPAVGFSPDGVLQLSWAYEDLSALTLTLELMNDGRLEWFFRDASTGVVEGSADEPEPMLSPRALALLETRFARRRHGGR